MNKQNILEAMNAAYHNGEAHLHLPMEPALRGDGLAEFMINEVNAVTEGEPEEDHLGLVTGAIENAVDQLNSVLSALNGNLISFYDPKGGLSMVVPGCDIDPYSQTSKNHFNYGGYAMKGDIKITNHIVLAELIGKKL